VIGIENELAHEGIRRGEEFGILAVWRDVTHVNVVANKGFTNETTTRMASTKNRIGAFHKKRVTYESPFI